MKIAGSHLEVMTCGSRVKRQARWAIISYRSPKSPTVIEHFNCFARSMAYLAAFWAVFDPSVGTRMVEIIRPPINPVKKLPLCMARY